jgi:hypothetical protein
VVIEKEHPLHEELRDLFAMYRQKADLEQRIEAVKGVLEEQLRGLGGSLRAEVRWKPTLTPERWGLRWQEPGGSWGFDKKKMVAAGITEEQMRAWQKWTPRKGSVVIMPPKSPKAPPTGQTS